MMSELEKRYHQVLGGMAGNESLTASLDEGAASELLSWGQAIAKNIVDETDDLDDDAADKHMAPRLSALYSMMRAMGRWTGEADTLDAESRVALWNRMMEQAQVIFGDPFVLPAMDDAIAQLPHDMGTQQVVIWLKTLVDDGKPKG